MVLQTRATAMGSAMTATQAPPSARATPDGSWHSPARARAMGVRTHRAAGTARATSQTALARASMTMCWATSRGLPVRAVPRSTCRPGSARSSAQRTNWAATAPATALVCRTLSSAAASTTPWVCSGPGHALKEACGVSHRPSVPFNNSALLGGWGGGHKHRPFKDWATFLAPLRPIKNFLWRLENFSTTDGGAHPAQPPTHQTAGLRERGNDTSRSTGRSGRQNAATRRNMRREERVTVQGPVKEQQPDGMSHRRTPPLKGALGIPPPHLGGPAASSSERTPHFMVRPPRFATADRIVTARPFCLPTALATAFESPAQPPAPSSAFPCPDAVASAVIAQLRQKRPSRTRAAESAAVGAAGALCLLLPAGVVLPPPLLPHRGDGGVAGTASPPPPLRTRWSRVLVHGPSSAPVPVPCGQRARSCASHRRVLFRWAPGDALGWGEVFPSPSGRPACAQPLSPRRQVPASLTLITDSNRPQPLWQPPTACLTASGAASAVPWGVGEMSGRRRGRDSRRGGAPRDAVEGLGARTPRERALGAS